MPVGAKSNQNSFSKNTATGSRGGVHASVNMQHGVHGNDIVDDGIPPPKPRKPRATRARKVATSDVNMKRYDGSAGDACAGSLATSSGQKRKEYQPIVPVQQDVQETSPLPMILVDTTDKDNLEDDANPIDELDKANFIKKDTPASSSGKKQRSDVSAAEFHPNMLLDNAHTTFIEEIKSCGVPESDNCDKVDEEMISPMRMFFSHPKDGEPMFVHMDYWSEQLKNFDMAESDEEEGGNLPEMQCLPDKLIKVIGSTKKSLLDTLEKADSEKKGKFQEGASTKWGPVLSSRPTTRGHGDINIIDKAKAYQKKKNLDIPPSFKGSSII
ncbi:hypothetical protein D1007_21086 [Hordeum vulgare]|nr:hypothetical protein D1007_21086 [Hordeum vulgare]